MLSLPGRSSKKLSKSGFAPFLYPVRVSPDHLRIPGVLDALLDFCDFSPVCRSTEMNRKEMLRLLLNQAQFNGFELRRWFQTHVQPVWPGTEQALALLAEEDRYYTLLFSHDFACCFWRTGASISFRMPAVTYLRISPEGMVMEVTRKPHTRRTIKPDVWKYHLSRMVAADNPLEYICRFIPPQDQIRMRKNRPVPVPAQA
jgi:hypothetical protein